MRKANPQNDAQAAQLRAEGLSYPAIARRLGVGLATAHRAVQRVTAEHRGESPEVAREVEVARLDVIYQHAAEILNADHATVSSGRLVRDGGVPVVDPRVKMQALDRMLAVTDRRIRLLALDRPRTVITADVLDAEIERLTAEIADLDAMPPAPHALRADAPEGHAPELPPADDRPKATVHKHPERSR
jgi:hypothetical protein